MSRNKTAFQRYSIKIYYDYIGLFLGYTVLQTPWFLWAVFKKIGGMIKSEVSQD